MQAFPIIYSPSRQGEQMTGEQHYHGCSDLGNLRTCNN